MSGLLNRVEPPTDYTNDSLIPTTVFIEFFRSFSLSLRAWDEASDLGSRSTNFYQCPPPSTYRIASHDVPRANGLHAKTPNRPAYLAISGKEEEEEVPNLGWTRRLSKLRRTTVPECDSTLSFLTAGFYHPFNHQLGASTSHASS
ncbi:hypothetical protein M407DRAFT_34472 [Tulasnella calospora MUT 4182]|uniref:Uncharacterized protein n=1 Tax=Tulasnella calospora MUT 4182 TaxID=1051891 RepID=A0A0C3Q0L7_9AGAM|nr:hypothetical protein M407DRAFT_34472 [Tulasnella calospora MUT 4182]